MTESVNGRRTRAGRGNFRADLDVAQIAREVISALMGLEIQWLADPEWVDLAEAMEPISIASLPSSVRQPPYGD
jgi:hypothetical protein